MLEKIENYCLIIVFFELNMKLGKSNFHSNQLKNLVIVMIGYKSEEVSREIIKGISQLLSLLEQHPIQEQLYLDQNCQLPLINFPVQFFDPWFKYPKYNLFRYCIRCLT